MKVSDEAFQVVQQWQQAFCASDVDGIVSLYAPDAIFIGTSSQRIVTTTALIRDYFEKALLNHRPRGAKLASYQITELSNELVILTGLDSVTAVRNGVPESAQGRVSFVLAKREGVWKIVHFHRSVMPN